MSSSEASRPVALITGAARRIGATIARREPIIRLKRVDFPTLGRPTSTTKGGVRVILSEIDDHLAFTLTA